MKLRCSTCFQERTQGDTPKPFLLPETHPGAQANGGDMSTRTVLSSFIFISHPNTSVQETPPKSSQHSLGSPARGPVHKELGKGVSERWGLTLCKGGRVTKSILLALPWKNFISSFKHTPTIFFLYPKSFRSLDHLRSPSTSKTRIKVTNLGTSSARVRSLVGELGLYMLRGDY